jgi:hypothetical protein
MWLAAERKRRQAEGGPKTDETIEETENISENLLTPHSLLARCVRAAAPLWLRCRQRKSEESIEMDVSSEMKI